MIKTLNILDTAAVGIGLQPWALSRYREEGGLLDWPGSVQTNAGGAGWLPFLQYLCHGEVMERTTTTGTGGLGMRCGGRWVNQGSQLMRGPLLQSRDTPTPRARTGTAHNIFSPICPNLIGGWKPAPKSSPQSTIRA